ncbi:MAG: hypothetical protein BGO34_16155 [Bacteroidia bacterium 44-10]|nr:MAG: hypothetical protein BGO34_16155 [Bacteroidia bacterium 44-10]
MHNGSVSDIVRDKVSDLRIYLIEELKMSREAAHKRTDRIEVFLLSLAHAVDYYQTYTPDLKQILYIACLF